ncbi:MAG TPA: metal/formaldehyde-sensitive transcriptional repressor [Planctomycetota bacterium]|nr:metal/formaldehyde-sensitive transcriptional repressor [Planctomycetota bacterium]
MAHTIHDKVKLLARVRRIRGQVEGVERLLEEEKDCNLILQTIASCRGAIDSLMAEVMEGHIRTHVVDPKEKNAERVEAVEQLIDVIRAYLK